MTPVPKSFGLILKMAGTRLAIVICGIDSLYTMMRTRLADPAFDAYWKPFTVSLPIRVYAGWRLFLSFLLSFGTKRCCSQATFTGC